MRISSKNKALTLALALLIICSISIVSAETSFYLNLETDPSEVLTIDPNALTGEGSYDSGTCVIIDAKQTVTSGTVRYEFVEWSTQDPWTGDPEEEPELIGNQAFIMMDGDRTVTAIYEKTVEEKWDIKLTGEFDYLQYENIKVRLAALVTSSDTGSPVSYADVIIDIYDEDGNNLVSTDMVEKLTGTGIYEWKSPQTIKRLMLSKKINKGVYLVHVQASHNGVPVASDILEFHIDPPGKNPTSNATIAVIIIAVLASIITPLILVKQRVIQTFWKSS